MSKEKAAWSEGILKAFELLHVTPPLISAVKSDRPLLPSDFLEKDLELDKKAIERLEKDCRLSDAEIVNLFYSFSRSYFSQKIFEHNKTDLNVFFCDFLLFSSKAGYSIENYFDFEFYARSISEQNTFWGEVHRKLTRLVANTRYGFDAAKNKSVFNR